MKLTGVKQRNEMKRESEQLQIQDGADDDGSIDGTWPVIIIDRLQVRIIVI